MEAGSRTLSPRSGSVLFHLKNLSCRRSRDESPALLTKLAVLRSQAGLNPFMSLLPNHSTHSSPWPWVLSHPHQTQRGNPLCWSGRAAKLPWLPNGSSLWHSSGPSPARPHHLCTAGTKPARSIGAGWDSDTFIPMGMPLLMLTSIPSALATAAKAETSAASRGMLLLSQPLGAHGGSERSRMCLGVPKAVLAMAGPSGTAPATPGRGLSPAKGLNSHHRSPFPAVLTRFSLSLSSPPPLFI